MSRAELTVHRLYDTMHLDRKHVILKLLVAFALLPTNVFAQSVVANFDEKVIYTDSLNLPKNTSVSEVLRLLPELLQRPGDFMISNYDIQVEGMSVGNACDVALQQLQIVDVEKINVSESPVSSYNNNGQGGSIDIILRSSSNDNKSYWGSAGVTVSYPFDVAPQVNIGYKNKKFMVRGMMLGEVYNNIKDTETSTYKDGLRISNIEYDDDHKFQAQLARVYMQYKPTDKDVLKFNVSEVFSNSNQTTIHVHDVSEASDKHERSTMLRGQFNYQHKFKRSTFEFETQYLYNPGVERSSIPTIFDVDAEYHGHNISGRLEFSTQLLPAPTPSKPNVSSLKLTVGSNFNGVITPTDYNAVQNESQTFNTSTKIKTWYAMPYAMLEGKFGKFNVKAVGEYQFFEYNINLVDQPYSAKRRDFTGKLMSEWHFTPHKNLRLIFKRNLQRPSSEQLYPFTYYDARNSRYVKGNTDLSPMMSHEVILDYISDYKWKINNSIVLNAGISYNNVSDIIRSDNLNDSGASDGQIGSTLSYKTYNNQGTNHILSANLMALYSYKAFSLSFTGNVYHNDKKSEDANKLHYTYYNLSIYPHFNLKDGWYGGAQLIYYSKVDMKEEQLSDCALTRMTIGKSWKKLFVYVYQEVTLHKYAEDRMNGENNTYIIRSYEMIPDMVGLGFKYTF